MTREDAKTILYEWQKSMVEHGVPIDTSKVQALRVAIEALSKPNYESDNEVRLAVTDRNKDKVVLWDAFGEVEYYPNGEINCVHCPHYHETEDETGVHSHCGSHGRLIDADAMVADLLTVDPQFESMIQWCITVVEAQPTVQADRPHGEWIVNTDDSCGGITLTCSDCGEQFNFDDADEVLDFKEHAHFCINCGAKMGGDKECL